MNGRLRLHPKTRKGERNRATSKEDTSHQSRKVSNPTRGCQQQQKEDLPGKDPKRETKGKGSEGGPQSKHKTDIREEDDKKEENAPSKGGKETTENHKEERTGRTNQTTTTSIKQYEANGEE